MKRARDYDGELPELRSAKRHVEMAARHLRTTGARQTKKKLQSLVKSLDGAIRNAEGHRSRTL